MAKPSFGPVLCILFILLVPYYFLIRMIWPYTKWILRLSKYIYIKEREKKDAKQVKKCKKDSKRTRKNKQVSGPGLYKRILFVQERPRAAKCPKSVLFDFLSLLVHYLLLFENLVKCGQMRPSTAK